MAGIDLRAASSAQTLSFLLDHLRLTKKPRIFFDSKWRKVSCLRATLNFSERFLKDSPLFVCNYYRSLIKIVKHDSLPEDHYEQPKHTPSNLKRDLR